MTRFDEIIPNLSPEDLARQVAVAQVTDALLATQGGLANGAQGEPSVNGGFSGNLAPVSGADPHITQVVDAIEARNREPGAVPFVVSGGGATTRPLTREEQQVADALIEREQGLQQPTSRPDPASAPSGSYRVLRDPQSNYDANGQFNGPVDPPNVPTGLEIPQVPLPRYEPGRHVEGPVANTFPREAESARRVARGRRAVPATGGALPHQRRSPRHPLARHLETEEERWVRNLPYTLPPGTTIDDNLRLPATRDFDPGNVAQINRLAKPLPSEEERAAIINDGTGNTARGAYGIGNIVYKYNNDLLGTGSENLDNLKTTGKYLPRSIPRPRGMPKGLDVLDQTAGAVALQFNRGVRRFDAEDRILRGLEKEGLFPLTQEEHSRLRDFEEEAYLQGQRGGAQFEPDNDAILNDQLRQTRRR